MIAITPAGRRVLKRAPMAAQEQLIAAVGRLAATDAITLANLLNELVSAAGLGGTEPKLFFEEKHA